MLNKLKGNNLFTLILFEVTGYIGIGLFIFLFNLEIKWLTYAVALAIPIGMALEIICNIMFLPVRKISIFYNLSSRKNNAIKNDNVLLTLNISRTLFLLSLFTLISIPFVPEDKAIYAKLIGGIGFPLFLWNVFRQEYLFRITVYNKKIAI